MTSKVAKALALAAIGKFESLRASEAARRDDIRRVMLTEDESVALVESIMRVRGENVSTEELAGMLNDVVALRFLASCSELASAGLIDIDYNPAAAPGDRLTFKNRADIDDALRSVLKEGMKGGK